MYFRKKLREKISNMFQVWLHPNNPGNSYLKYEVDPLPKEMEDLIKLRKIESFDRVSVDFISHDFKDLHSTEVAKLREKKVPILSWTIKSEADEEIAREYSDNITFEGYMAKHIF